MEKGYKEVTMSMLVKATGLSKGAFYHYFENKGQLFIETLDNLFFSVSPFNKEMIINPEVSFYDYMQIYIDNVKKMSKMINSYIGEKAVGMGYYRLMIDIANYAPEFYDKIKKSNNNKLIFWEKIIQIGVQKGELKKDMDLEILAKHFQWLQDGIAMSSFLSGDAKEMSKNLDKSFEQLYDMVKI
ncbi:MAG: TetR/AcrR family transcriptional regulator [Bacteroidales bacterium]|nr:TetR/AcrR family transcriptional regulator [Bacteroidales bacterium]